MENKRCAKLVLNTNLFYPQSTGSIAGAGALDTTMGTADPVRTTCTFTNLNWKLIMGDLFDEYEEFNLILVSATYCGSGGTAFGVGTNAFSINVKASGLNWLNQNYDVYSRTLTSETTFLSCNITNAAIQQPVYNACTFRRPSGNGMSDFVIKMYRALDNLQTSVGDRHAAFVYVFNIYGVESSKVKA